MDHHDLVSAYRGLEQDKGIAPTKREYLSKFPKYEAFLARIGGWQKLLLLVGASEKREPAKILLFDIEASHLKANMGYVFCIGYQWVGEDKVHLVSIRDFGAYKKDRCCDKAVIKAFAKIFDQADVVVSWYGLRYDLPFLQSRLMMHGLKPMKEVAHIDGWRIAKYRLNFTSNRLDTLSKVIPSSGTRELKTEVDFEHWKRASAGYENALKYIEEHCVKDIKVLGKVYKAIRPFAANLPNIGKWLDPKREGCPSCGSANTSKQGFKITHRGRKQQYQCQDCGQWFCGNAERIKKP